MAQPFEREESTSIFGFARDLVRRLCDAICFAVENAKPRYPYTLVGEKHDSENQNTILFYRVSGKRHIFEMPAKELCNSKDMIERFHPLDVRIISFITGIEQIIEIPTADRKQAFDKLKTDIFNKKDIE